MPASHQTTGEEEWSLNTPLKTVDPEVGVNTNYSLKEIDDNSIFHLSLNRSDLLDHPGGEGQTEEGAGDDR